jgi:hypothetical protein
MFPYNNLKCKTIPYLLVQVLPLEAEIHVNNATFGVLTAWTTKDYFLQGCEDV